MSILRYLVVALAVPGVATAQPPPRPEAARAHAARLAEMGPGGRLLLQLASTDVDPRRRAPATYGLARTDAARLRALVLDPDATVRAAAVSGLMASAEGVRWLRSRLDRDPAARLTLGAATRRSAALQTWIHLQQLVPEHGWIVGIYPGLFSPLAPLGEWAVDPLLAIGGRERTRRPPPTQLLAIAALGALRERAAIPALERLVDRYTRGPMRVVGREVAVALHHLGRPDAAAELLQRTRWRGRRGRPDREFQAAVLLQRTDRLDEAIDAYGRALRSRWAERRRHAIHYNLACAHAGRRHTESALHHLQQALRNGFDARDWIARDTRLDRLRKDPRFARLLADPKAPISFGLRR